MQPHRVSAYSNEVRTALRKGTASEPVLELVVFDARLYVRVRGID